jgi:predicted NAD/FAD-binding protein
MYHQLLDTVATTLRWRSFRNGSIKYVDTFLEQLPKRHRLHLETIIAGVAQMNNGASVKFSDGSRKDFDHMVLAIHAKQDLALLGHDATDAQRTILGAFTTSRNVCYLHSDETVSLSVLKPARSLIKLAPTKASFGPCGVELLPRPVTRGEVLQDIPMPGEPGSPGRVLVTMNPNQTPQASQSSHVYHHPLITSGSI